MGYKYKVEKNGVYFYFSLYPNNSNAQPIGCSKNYVSKSECLCGLKLFQKIVSNNNIYSLLQVENDINELHYFPYLQYEGEKIFKRTIHYSHKDECQKWLKRIIDNVDSKIV